MSGNFTSLWYMSFSWLGKLITMPLPIYFGGVALSLLDIVIGTVFIIATFGFIRALIKSGFSIAGKDLIADRKHQAKIRDLNAQTHAEFENRQRGIAYIDNLKREGKL